MVTLAHKMLHTIYAMLTNGNHCEDKQVGYEAFNVQRSAQRAAPLTGAGWRCTRCFQFGRMAIPRGVLCLLHNQAIRSPATPCARSRQPSLTGL